MTTSSTPDHLQPIPQDQAMPHRKVIREWLLPLSDRSTLRAFVLLIVDTALFMGLVAGTVFFESVWLKLLCGMAAGFVIGRLFIIGHDACHQSLTPHRELNKWIGRYAFLYSLTPFSLWDTGHNVVHHGYTNLKGVDFVWTPLTAEEFAALGPVDRLLQYLYRSGWAPGLYYLIEIWWKREFFPNKTHMPTRRPIFFKDSLLVTVFGVLWMGAMTYAAIATEQSVALTLLMGVLLPFLFWNTMIGFVVYVHHTHGAPHHGAHRAPRGHEHSSLSLKASPSQVGRNVARPHHCSALLLGLVLQNSQGMQAVRLLTRMLDRLQGSDDKSCAWQLASQNLKLLRAFHQYFKCGQGLAF
jgi:omega-6 fatty acid desaturase (delta-12 desaturase)